MPWLILGIVVALAVAGIVAQRAKDYGRLVRETVRAAIRRTVLVPKQASSERR
jgi:hypothetical protein